MLVDDIRVEIEKDGKLYRFSFPHVGVAKDFFDRLVPMTVTVRGLEEVAEEVLEFKKKR